MRDYLEVVVVTPMYMHVYIYMWVRILASVIFFICYVAFFLSLLPWRSVGRSNFDWGLQKFNNIDSNNDRQIKRNTMLRIESTVNIP